MEAVLTWQKPEFFMKGSRRNQLCDIFQTTMTLFIIQLRFMLRYEANCYKANYGLMKHRTHGVTVNLEVFIAGQMTVLTFEKYWWFCTSQQFSCQIHTADDEAQTQYVCRGIWIYLSMATRVLCSTHTTHIRIRFVHWSRCITRMTQNEQDLSNVRYYILCKIFDLVNLLSETILRISKPYMDIARVAQLWSVAH